jgi:uncharacterized protein YodC (DUF2158 family)
MTKSKPQIGDIVHLNSGSPDLKVLSFCEACGMVEVEWQANGTTMMGRFPLACVRQS